MNDLVVGDGILLISPTEFEKYCLEVLKAFAEKENLNDFSIKHNVKINADDGTYQIDVLAQFTALGTRFKVLAECKQYHNPVPREKVELLHSRLESTGAQKGIIMSTSGYQSGALQYAEKHGIALLQIYDKHWRFHSYSRDSKQSLPEQRQALFYKLHPPIYAEMWNGSEFSGEIIYPTEDMIKEIHKQVNSTILDGCIKGEE